MTSSDRQRVIDAAAELGWTFTHSKKGYDKLKCPCGAHLTWLHRTPSNPNYWNERIAHMQRVCPPPETAGG